MLDLSRSLVEKVNSLVMTPSWIFPAQARLSYERSEPSQAELEPFNFWAESELKKKILALILIKNYNQISKFSNIIMIITNSN